MRPPLIPVTEAQSRILAKLSVLPAETICLTEAYGRVLAADLLAELTQPPFNASAMDGYAVRSADVSDAPVELDVVGEAAAGVVSLLKVDPGQAIRIFTGGVVPEGSDVVIIQENVTRLDGNRIRVEKGETAGRHIRAKGLDFKAGDVVLRAGCQMTPRDIALAAAANGLWPQIRRKPRVGILATGDELVRVGGTPGPGQIINSNTPALAALVTANGGIPVDLGIARDNAASLTALARDTRNIDLFITIGGASVGDHDLVQRVLGQAGLQVDFWRIAMRPGKPLMFGDFNGTPMIGLPGNPVAAMICGLVFIIPALRKMLGMSDTPPCPETAALGSALPENDERQDYIRATLDLTSVGLSVATPFSRQDSSMLNPLAAADCVILRMPHAAAAATGDQIPIIRLSPRGLSL